MQMLTWRDIILQEKKLPYFKNIVKVIKYQKAMGIKIYPSLENIFNAFYLTEFNSVKVVIIGQDPYHGPNQAHGLSFSVPPGIALPPSLVNIYKELMSDITDFIFPIDGCLTKWAKQGVLLLNSILTVEAGKAHSHAHLGWEIFTDKIIRILSDHKQEIIFLLWGQYAKKKVY